MTDAKSISLFAAVSSGNLSKARKMLNKGVNPNFICNLMTGETYPLLTAVKKNNMRMVALLLEHGAKWLCICSPILFLALDQFNYTLVRLLLDTQSPTSMQRKYITKAFLYKYCRTDLAVVDDTLDYKDIGRLLLERGADPFFVCEYDGTFPLWIAAEKGNFIAVEVLVKHCKRFNCFEELIHQTKSATKSSPLYVACQNGHFHVVDYLLSCGACVDAQTMYGSFPLFVAAGRGYIRIVEHLLVYKANVSLLCGNESSSEYAYRCNYEDIGDLLAKVEETCEYAHFSNVDYFMQQIGGDNIPPYPMQWLRYMQNMDERELLLDWVSVQLHDSIVSGSIPLGLERFIKLLGGKRRTMLFYAWLQECRLFEEVCVSKEFNEKYNPLSHEVAAYLLYPKKETRRLLHRLYQTYM